MIRHGFWWFDWFWVLLGTEFLGSSLRNGESCVSEIVVNAFFVFFAMPRLLLPSKRRLTELASPGVAGALATFQRPRTALDEWSPSRMRKPMEEVASELDDKFGPDLDNMSGDED